MCLGVVVGAAVVELGDDSAAHTLQTSALPPTSR